MLVVLLRAVLLYLVVLTVLRLMGKRQIAQLQPYELALTLVIAELAAAPMGNNDIPLLHGVLPILALTAVNALVTIITLKSMRARATVCGKPSVVIRNGVVDEQELRKLGCSLSDLMEQVRLGGIACLSDVAVAVLETGGGLSVFPCAAIRPVQPRDMNLAPDPRAEKLPVTLVLDGRVLSQNLRLLHKDEGWLAGALSAMNAPGPQGLLWALVDGSDALIAQPRASGGLLRMTACGARGEESI